MSVLVHFVLESVDKPIDTIAKFPIPWIAELLTFEQLGPGEFPEWGEVLE